METQFDQPAYKQKKTNLRGWVILGLITLICAVGIYKVQTRAKATPKPVTYSAVFLTDGQVYFGQLTESVEYDNLSHVYYIQSVQNGSTTQPTLVHMGSELHQPTDELKISKNQVLFVETLSANSPVLKAISGQ